MQTARTSTHSRAQGTITIPWPAAVSERPTTCCVALRVQVTQDRAGQDVDILYEVPRVSHGEPQTVLPELIDGLDTHLGEASRSAVLHEIDAIGNDRSTCPIVLARLEEHGGGRCRYLEALILPVSHERAAELAASCRPARKTRR